MTIDEFTRGLDRYGGNLGHWPADIRAGAEALIAENRTAADLGRVAVRLDRALAIAVEPLVLDAAFVGGIMANLAHHGGHEAVVKPTRRFVAWAGAAMMMFLVTGYAIGVALPTTTSAQGEDAVASLIFGDSGSSQSTGALGDLL
jgi:hypothetical protein